MKQETTLEEVAENFWLNDNSMSDDDRVAYINGFISCAKWQMERSYSEEEVLNILYKHTEDLLAGKKLTLEKWIEQFKKK